MNSSLLGRIGRLLPLVVTVVAACAIVAPAHAGPLLATTLTVPGATDGTCFARELASGPGVVKRSLRSPGYGLIKVRLVAASGDWELGVFDARTGRPVAGSAHYGARELAEGLVRKGQDLLVQACRSSGATRARMTVGFEALDRRAISDVELVRVSTPTPEASEKLASLGFETTEHHGLDFTDVFVQRGQQAAQLGRLGLISVVLDPNVEALRKAAIRSGEAFARTSATGLPSGRGTTSPCPVTGCYRTLAEYTSEMDALATAHPSFVKKITITNAATRTYEGRDIEGLEISTNVNARDGKPVFLMMGLHHVREWPAGEHTLEWAYELICGYSPDPPGGVDTPCPDSGAAPNARVVTLLQSTRVIIIPVINPDGYNISRTVGGVDGGNGRGGNELVNILSHPNEYRRKNCRLVPPDPPAPAVGNCGGPAFGVGSTGVDLNRNYGTFWGGPGSSADFTSETFHGPHCPGDNPVKGAGCGPFSEPETEAVRQLISKRHVTTLITNHTFTGLVLRAPGLASQGLTVDEPAMQALGDAMAAQNGYVSQYGWQLYDTTGTTEDWSYNTTGGYGYTFEIGPKNFHPPYAEMIQEYDGTATWPEPDPLEGNREAYFLALENTADPLHHSVVFGSAPAGAVLRLKKTVQTPTSIRDANQAYRTFTDTLDTTMVVPAGGSYTWHINPSTRPLVAKTRGRLATGTPSSPVAFNGSVTGPPADGAAPCGAASSSPLCYNEHPFTLPGAPADNATAVVRIQWTTPSSDWDMYIVHDLDGDGTVDAGEPVVGTSDQGTSANEGTSINEGTPGFVLGAKYVVKVVNFAATEPYTGSVEFLGPEPAQIATTESWTFTCEMPEGNVLSTQQLTIGRGNGVPSTPPPFPAPPSPQQRNFNAACAGGPTAVQVAAFAARALERGVAVTWRTANERDIAGFNLWRGRSGASTKVNRTLVPAKRAGGVGTASYRIVDRAGRPGSRPTYLLQVVKRDGTRAWVGTTMATQR